MLDHYKTLIVCRDTVRSLQIVATGTTTLGVSGNAYTRAAGSFVTEGYIPGMEVTPTGFVGTEPNVIKDVATDKLTLRTPLADDAQAAGRSLLVGIPKIRAWEGLKIKPKADLWYINDDYLPGGSPQRVTSGTTTSEWDYEPIYHMRVLSLDDYGNEALYKVADSILSLFKPYEQVGTVDGRAVMVRNDMAPYRGQALPSFTETGKLEVAITIPLRVRTFNS